MGSEQICIAYGIGTTESWFHPDIEFMLDEIELWFSGLVEINKSRMNLPIVEIVSKAGIDHLFSYHVYAHAELQAWEILASISGVTGGQYGSSDWRDEESGELERRYFTARSSLPDVICAITAFSIAIERWYSACEMELANAYFDDDDDDDDDDDIDES